MIKYIAINGPARSGRTTLARELSRYLSSHGTVVLDSIEAPIKHFVATTLGDSYKFLDKELERSVLYGYSVNTFKKRLRHFLEDEFGPDVLTRWLVHRNLRPLKIPNFVIIDDASNKDNIESLPNRIVVTLRRDDCKFDSDETYLPAADFIIDNSEHVIDLYKFASIITDRITTPLEGDTQ